MCILYIDDDPEDIEIFHEGVKAVDPSIQYFSATSGREAFEFLNRTETLPDHILIDINMPGMDGKRCLEEIRRERRFDAIPITIYSTNSFAKDIEHIHFNGAKYVKKANSFEDLCRIVRELLAQKRTIL